MPPPPGIRHISPFAPTARATARRTNGQVEAGTLIGANEISIQWEAPADPGVYMITVRSSVGSVVDRDTAWVMVRRCDAINAGLRYAFYPNLVEGDLYFVGTNGSLSDRSFLGLSRVQSGYTSHAD